MACFSPSQSYNQVKEEIHHLFTSSLLPSIDAGLTLTELCREYESCYKHGPIPYQDLGYETLSRFLGSMKDVIRMSYKEWPTRCYLNTDGDQNKNKTDGDQNKNKTNGDQNKNKTNGDQNKNKTDNDQNKSKKRVHTGSETYDEVKNDIHSILISSLPVENGLSFTELCQHYSLKNDGRQMPFERLGYASFTDLLKTMWDVVRIEKQRCYLRVKETMKVNQKKNKYKQ